MRVVVAEIQGQQIEPWMPDRDHVGIGVGLFVTALALDARQRLVRRHEELIVGVMERIEEIQHVQEQQRGKPVEREGLRRPPRQGREQGAAHQQHGNRASQVGPLRHHEEWPYHDLCVHQQLTGRHVRPLEDLQCVEQGGMAPQQPQVIETREVRALDVVADVHVPNSLEGCVAGSGDETHGFARAPIGAGRRKQGLVRSLMHEVGGQDHGVHTQQDSQSIQCDRAGRHERERPQPAEGRPRQHAQVGCRRLAIAKQRRCQPGRSRQLSSP